MKPGGPETRTVRWRPWTGTGLEHLTLAVEDHAAEGPEIVARSVVIGARGGRPYGVDYTLVCDQAWRVREFHLGTTEGRALSLLHDGRGAWTNHDGRALPEFDGCLDVDLAGTPFTNTLPIRRIDWDRTGDRRVALTMLYVPFDTFVPRPDAQAYTCLDDGRRFRYEATERSFETELPVDADGLVLDYPGLFRREPETT